MKRVLLIPIVAFAALAFTGCAAVDGLFGSRDVIESVSPEEQPALRVIAASMTVKGAYTTIEQKLDEGVISVDEARKVKLEIDKVAAAVEVAATAVNEGGGDGELRLANAAVRAFLLSDLFQELIQ